MVPNIIGKLDGKKLVILSLLALGIDESSRSIVYFTLDKFAKWKFFELNEINKQLFFCLNLAIPIYFLIVLVLMVILDRKILLVYYDKYHRIFLWILIFLILVSTILIYYYIFNRIEYTIGNFEQFRSSICLR